MCQCNSLYEYRTVHWRVFFLLLCSGFSCRSRPPMTPVFSIISSSLYNIIIFHVIARHPVYHRSTVSHEFLYLPFCLLSLYTKEFTTQHMTCHFFCLCLLVFIKLLFHPPCPKQLDWIGVQSDFH